MTTLKINGTEYKIKFGYNSFCDTDLLDRTSEIMGIIQDKSITKDNAFTRRLFCITRELLFEGFKKFNPVENIEAVGNLLDDYLDEGSENEDHGLMALFGLVAKELIAEGFFGDLLKQAEKSIQMITAKAKKSQKKV